MSYVDGFVLPVPEANLPAYLKMAKTASKVWKEHGALEYRECVGDDMNAPGLFPFPKMVKLKPGEVVVIAWIVFKSKAHRDKVNAKVMKDPRLACDMGSNKLPFELKRMAYGGFKVIVQA